MTVSIDGRTAHARTDAVANAIGGAGTHVARYTADFARLDSVRTLTDALTSDFPRIDVLLDNAGGAYAGDVRTVDGNEINYQVNALPPFLLTKSLTPALDGGLVVSTSSRSHRGATLTCQGLADQLDRPTGLGPHRRYARAELATPDAQPETSHPRLTPRRMEGVGHPSGEVERWMDHRWGFEEADDVDERGEEPAAGELLTGADADGVVTVSVDDAANVRSVHLGAGWEDDAVRRGLGGKVVDAMTGATTRAMAKQAERIAPGAAEPAPASASKSSEQDSPLTTEDVMRLLHEVARDLGQFRQRLSAVVDETVTVASGGGHVTVSGRRQQVGDVSIDQDWLYRTRASEVESELRDALTAFRARSAPGELAPQSNAISELRSLVSDPQAMVRRIRQRNGSRR